MGREVCILFTGGAVSVDLLNLLVAQLATALSRNGHKAYGLNFGFGAMLLSNPPEPIALTPEYLASTNDSYLITERDLPNRSAAEWAVIAAKFNALGIRDLVIIGGNGSACTISQIRQHVPACFDVIVQLCKTMDGDYVDPFSDLGFQSALAHAIEELNGYRKETSLLGATCVSKVLGRDVGQLAWHAGRSVGASVILIPEEFKRIKLKISCDQLINMLIAVELKKFAETGNFGLVVLAEGILDCLDEESQNSLGVHRKSTRECNAINFAKSEFEASIQELMKEKFKSMGLAQIGASLQISSRRVGYHARAASPIEADRILAVAYAERAAAIFSHPESQEGSKYIVIHKDGEVSLEELLKSDGEAQQCWVDVLSSDFRRATKEQFRVGGADLSGNNLKRITSLTNLTADEMQAFLKPSVAIFSQLAAK